jgi:histidinol dehydrogenase
MNKRMANVATVRLDSPRGTRRINTIERMRAARDREVATAVEKVIEDVRREGDRALFHYTSKFDRTTLSARTVRIEQAQIDHAAAAAPAALKTAIREASKRIRAYHHKQRATKYSMTTAEGSLSQIVRPIDRAGVYIPGGHTVYPSTVLMNVIPARIAGVREIAAVTPPRGELAPAVAYALKHLRVTEVYRIGGAQAIAALAYGTRSVRRVDKIVGPGSAYVAAAKRAVFGAVDIDSVAGPSEVAILCDDSVDPAWVALDLLSQAEHGSGDEIAITITENQRFAEAVREATVAAMHDSPRRAVFSRLPAHAISIFVTRDRAESIDLVNRIAPEHLQIITRTARADCKRIRNAAAIFLGPYTPVALGDYAIGTNHVLPTGGGARFASPLGVESFLKRMSVARVDRRGLARIAPYVSLLARSEDFIHHALSAERRLER